MSELSVMRTVDDEDVHVPTTSPLRASSDTGAQSHEVDRTRNVVTKDVAEQENHPSLRSHRSYSVSSSLHPSETPEHAKYETQLEQQHLRGFQKLILKAPKPSTRIAKLEVHVTNAITLCNATGNSSLGQALDSFFKHIIDNPPLLDLFDAIFSQSATQAQIKEFQKQFKGTEKEMQSPGLKRKRSSQRSKADTDTEGSKRGNAVPIVSKRGDDDTTGEIHSLQAHRSTKDISQRMTKSRQAAIQMAKKAFIAKWDNRTGQQPGNRARIKRLCKFADVRLQEGTSRQEPFGEVDRQMELVSCFGSHTVQEEIVRELHLWMASEDITLPTFDPPLHLAAYEPAKRILYEQLWIASKILDWRSTTKRSNKLLWRITVTKFMIKHDEAVALLQREDSTSKSDNIQTKKAFVGRINHALYPEFFTTPINTKYRESKFRQERRSGKPYLALQQHFRSDGIIAMIPLGFYESYMNTPERTDFLLDALDILRPDFHSSSRLKLCSRILNCVYLGVKPKDEDMRLLDRCSRSDPGARRLEDFKLQFPDSTMELKGLLMDGEQPEEADEDEVTKDLQLPRKKKARIGPAPGADELMPNGEIAPSDD
ncbi:MAG: hypothetical protein Q9213_000361 [Squamulea squamosa]